MKWLTNTLIILAGLALLAPGALAARDSDRVTKTFPAVKLVRLESSMGSCIVKAGSADQVTVSLDYEFSGSGYYEPEMELDGDELVLGERVRCRHCEVSAEWTITVPAETEVRFETASGDLDASGITNRIVVNIASGDVTLDNCSGQIDVETASGNLEIHGTTGELSASTASGSVDLQSCSGEINVSTASGSIRAADLRGNLDISTASGTVRANDLSGTVELSTASGDVRATGIKVEGPSSFSSASGDATVTLASSPTSDIQVSSASGDAVLRYNGNQIQGHFELTALADDGDISAPFKFDTEREFRRHGQEYVRKAFAVGTGGPEVTISTGSGEAALEK